jgi:hypothetical protein
LDGRGRFELADHPDFALKRPFTLEVQANTDPQVGVTQEAILVERGDASGAKVYSLRLLPGERVRFALQGEDGKKVQVEGKLPGDARMLRLFVTLDEAGELTLRDTCEVIAKTKMSVRPRLSLDARQAPVLRIAGSSLEDAGFRGELVSVILERGVPEFHERTSLGPSGSSLPEEMRAHLPPEVRERFEKQDAYATELRKMRERHRKEEEELRTKMLGEPASPSPLAARPRPACSWSSPRGTFVD